MNQTKIIISFLMLVLPLTSTVSGQEQKDTIAPKSAISFVPQYLIKNGLRVDYDIKLKKHHWLQLSPQFYLSENDPYYEDDYGYYEDETEFNQLLGAGIHIYHRYYPSDTFREFTPYIKYGVTWQYFNLIYDEQLFNNYVERYTNIHKTGADVNFGVVTFINQYIAIDIYAGLGFRDSNHSSDAESPRKFNDFFDSYGFTGNIINLGLRISLYNY